MLDHHPASCLFDGTSAVGCLHNGTDEQISGSYCIPHLYLGDPGIDLDAAHHPIVQRYHIGRLPTGARCRFGPGARTDDHFGSTAPEIYRDVSQIIVCNHHRLLNGRGIQSGEHTPLPEAIVPELASELRLGIVLQLAIDLHHPQKPAEKGHHQHCEQRACNHTPALPVPEEPEGEPYFLQQMDAGAGAPGCLGRLAVVPCIDLCLEPQVGGGDMIKRDPIRRQQAGHPQRMTTLGSKAHRSVGMAVKPIQTHLLSLRTQIFHCSNYPGNDCALLLHAADLQVAAGDAQVPLSCCKADASLFVFQNPGTALHQHSGIGGELHIRPCREQAEQWFLAARIGGQIGMKPVRNSVFCHKITFPSCDYMAVTGIE